MTPGPHSARHDEAMKICLISHEYPPFPGGGIATYTEAAAKRFVAAGHQVHVVTNSAWFGETAPHLTLRHYRSGGLTIHRLGLFDEQKQPYAGARFFDTNPTAYAGRSTLWAFDPSNLAAFQIAAFVEYLHAEVGLDVIEVPEYFAEAFYVIRRRRSGARNVFPPVCVIGHTSTRELLEVSKHLYELGETRHRFRMEREEYCLRAADALQTPSRSLLQRYERRFGGALPELRAVIPYFVDLPANLPPAPASLTGGSPYLVAVGRIEPRKGSDTLAQAFALLAPEFPDLKLVFLGREAWRNGESFDAFLQRHLPANVLARVVRPGNLPRLQVLSAVRDSRAFVHAAPWDNHPNAVLEAMGLGAACVVSDSGGHAEMVEDGASGLVFAGGDPDALAKALRRVLSDQGLRATLCANASARMRSLTNPETILRQKLDLFSAMVERERRSAPAAEPTHVPPFLEVGYENPALPGKGLVVLDACMADAAALKASIDSLRAQVANSPEWQVAVLLDGTPPPELPGGWARFSPLDPPPWLRIEPQRCVVFVKAGVRFDPGSLHRLVTTLMEHGAGCGAFLWLRPANAQLFPYLPDASLQDLLLTGTVIPPVFAVPAGSLRVCAGLEGLSYPEARLCGLMAAAAASAKLRFLHTGDVAGDFYLPLSPVTEDVQSRVLGYLETLGLLAQGTTLLGNLELPAAPAVVGVPPQNLGYVADLERIRDEHLALKNMAVVRFLRRMRVFDMLRRIMPRTKKVIGSGKR